MKRSVLIAACIVGGLVLAGCGESEPSADRDTSPQGSVPDRSSLDIAVNTDFRVDKSGASGSAIIVPASCAAGVLWQGAFYVISAAELKDVPDPQPAEPIDDVVVPGCNDTGGTSEPDLPTDAWTIEGVDPDQAILVQYP